MEEEKKEVRISLLTVLVIISIFLIIIVIMGAIIYKLNKDISIEEHNNTEIQTQLENLNEEALIEEKNIVEESNDSNNSIDADIDNNIVLYNGYEIEPKVGVQDPSDMKNSDEAKSKYNVTYYNYENGKYAGTTKGEFGKETYDGYSAVNNVNRIAMTKEYNAIPRSYTRINELPKELIDMADCTSVDIDSIDLDNDGKEEKVVCYTVSYSKGQIGDGEPQASSGIILFDSNYKKIADLASLEDGFWAGFKEDDRKIFFSLDETEYIDIDNDNIMEIIINVPVYEGTRISILKYSNGIIEGKTNLKASVMP